MLYIVQKTAATIHFLKYQKTLFSHEGVVTKWAFLQSVMKKWENTCTYVDMKLRTTQRMWKTYTIRLTPASISPTVPGGVQRVLFCRICTLLQHPHVDDRGETKGACILFSTVGGVIFNKVSGFVLAHRFNVTHLKEIHLLESITQVK